MSIATTLVQSRHLLELGLDPSTADMHWFDIDGYNPHKNDWKLMCGHHVVEDCDKGLYVPAWSLSALLEVMPRIEVLDIGIYQSEDGWICYLDDCEVTTEPPVRFAAPTPLDAAVQMVLWMLNNDLIEKGEQNEKD